MITSRSVHTTVNGIISFFFVVKQYSIVCVCVCVRARAHMCMPRFIDSSLDEHLSFCHVLAIVNSAAMNTAAHVSFLNYGFVQMYA